MGRNIIPLQPFLNALFICAYICITKICKNSEKSLGNLRRLVVTHTPE